jgi:hypothetical protein
MRGLLAGAVVVLLGFAAPRTFTVRTGAASVGQTLDAIVRAHGEAWWEIRRGEVGPIIFFYTFDGSGIGASPGKAR